MPKKPIGAVSLNPAELAALVNDEFGPGTMRFASDPYFEITRIPTGILSLDFALGGGFPRGRHIEIYGGYAVGKTYTVYRTIASAQRQGLACAFVDAEGTFDPKFAAKAGVDLSALALHQQQYGERAVDFMESLLRAGEYGVIALDSIAAVLPKTELETPLEGGGYNMHQAKLMSLALRKLTAANRSTVLIYINQMRDAIGVMFGKRSTTTGGRAMAFYASARLEMTRTENIKRSMNVVDPKTGDAKPKDVVVGHRVLVRVDKEKAGGAVTGTTTSFVFNYKQKGVDHAEDLLYVGRQLDLVGKKGSKWWVVGYEDETQVGREKFLRWIRKNVAVQEELEQRIWERASEENDDDEW